MSERWKIIEGVPGPMREVSTLGNVRERKQDGDKTILVPVKPYRDGKGVRFIRFQGSRGCRVDIRLHILVALAFVPNTTPYSAVHPKDGDYLFTNIDSKDLYWGPQKPKKGPMPSKLSEADRAFIRASSLKGAELAKQFDVSQATISNVRNGR